MPDFRDSQAGCAREARLRFQQVGINSQRCAFSGSEDASLNPIALQFNTGILVRRLH
jgi:hypothetical protein